MRAKPPTTCRAARIVAALLVLATALPAPESWAQGANEATKDIAADPQDAAYWLRNREGWFWYRDPLASTPRPAPSGPKPPRELVEFEAMQKAPEAFRAARPMLALRDCHARHLLPPLALPPRRSTSPGRLVA